MAKVRKFKDRRVRKPAPATSARELSDQSMPSNGPEENQVGGVASEEGVERIIQQPTQVRRPVARSARINSQGRRYAIRVPNLEAVMAHVHERDAQPILQVSALDASLTAQYQLYQPFCGPSHPHAFSFPSHMPIAVFAPQTGLTTAQHQDVRAPTSVELAGYSGLEDLPIIDKMMKHPEVSRIHQFFFRYNDAHCPAAVLLADPLVGHGRAAEHNRNRWNDGFPAWLYVRKHRDTKWTRDFMAERGGMRQAVYLSRCEEGWRWEQQLGDLLDCRKSLNLWIKVKA